jgi:hypothetical protein
MSEILAEYRSKSNPDKTYHIILAKDGTLYCDCWSWKKSRKCVHLDHYQLKCMATVLTPDDASLTTAINKAVDYLR